MAIRNVTLLVTTHGHFDMFEEDGGVCVGGVGAGGGDGGGGFNNLNRKNRNLRSRIAI